MKAAALGVVLTLVRLLASAQQNDEPIRGEIVFSNNGATAVTNLCTGEGIRGGKFLVDLYWAPDGVTNESYFVRASTYSYGPRAVEFFTSRPGQFNGGSRFVLLTNSWFTMCQVRVWESAFGATYEDALANSRHFGRNAWTGKSLIFRAWPWPECRARVCADPHPPNLPESGLQPFTVGDSNCLRGGGVLFESSSNTLVTNLCTGEPLRAGMGFLAGLYYAPDGDTNESAFALLGAPVPFGPEPGQFHGGVLFPPDIAPGQPALFQVRVWESAFGSIYEEAVIAPPAGGRSAATGKSGVLRANTSFGGLASPATDLGSNGLRSFYVGYPGCVAPGSVLFQNSPSSLVTNLCTAEPVAPGAQYLAALYYASDGATDEGQFTQLGEPVGFGPEPGRSHGGPRFATNGTAPGQSGMFQTRVWESAFGATYEEALAAPPIGGRRAITGKSVIVRVPTQPEGFPLQAPPESGNWSQPFYIGAPDCNAPGTVLFQNSLSTLVTNACTGQPLGAGTNFLAALYYAPAGLSNDALFVQLGASVSIGPQAGRIQGGPRMVPGTTSPGAAGMFQVRVWESEFGATYEQAITAPPRNGRMALTGKSVTVAVRTREVGGPASPAETIAGAGFTGFNIGFPLLSVNLENTAQTSVYSICTRLPLDADSNVVAALYFAPDGVTDESLFTPLGSAVGFGPAPGQLDGPPQFLPAPLFPGDVANFQVRIWESAFASTYEGALAAPPRFGRRGLTGKSSVVRLKNTGECPGVLSPASLVRAGLQAFYLGGLTCEDIRAQFFARSVELPPIGFRAAATGRLDMDALDDVVALDGDGEYVHVLISRGDGSFDLDPLGRLFVSGGQGVGLGDFDGDGHGDLLATVSGFQEVRLYPGQGDGSFGPALTNTLWFSPNGLAVADFNHDGRLDFATANYLDSSIALFVGDGHGHFASPVRSAVPFRTSRIVVAAFNEDCWPDLLAIQDDTSQPTVVTNDGHGGFLPSMSLPPNVPGTSFAAADFNGDGQVDLATVTPDTTSVTIFLDSDQHAFYPIVTYPVGLWSGKTVLTGDFNADARPDILMADTTIFITPTGGHSYYAVYLNQTEWPRLRNDTTAIQENRAILIDVLANDTSPGVPLRIRSITQPSYGTASIINQTNVLYVAGTNFSDADTFTYSIHTCEPGAATTAMVTVEAAPRLHIEWDGDWVKVQWPAISTARLWTATNLNSTWTPVTWVPVLTDDRWRLTITFDQVPSRFFRLQTD